jgi:hypothetical protein
VVFQRANVNVPAGASSDAAVVAGSGSEGDRTGDAADGFLINGSVNNGAASPFAQLAAFGNNRRNARSLYNGGLGVLLGNSAWAAAPYSFTDRPSPKPSYNDTQIVGSFAGPVKVPGLRNRANLFAGYQHTDDHNATTQSVLMPTAAERRGDFSQSVNAFAQPVRLVDPATGAPFAGNVIPQSRISPQAAALLRLYPAANVDGAGRYNYETPVLAATRQDALQLRFMQTLNPKNQLTGNVSIQRTRPLPRTCSAFLDAGAVSGVDVPITLYHRFSQFLSMRLRYQYTRLATDVTPYFANRENIAGDAGIGGVNQDPVNWGPPALTFSSGIAGLSSAQYTSNRDRTHGFGGESIWSHGRHTITAGGDARIRRLDVVSQQNARGAFTFTGASTGSDLADFLLGLPHASAIAFGNADKFLRATSADAYVTDDMRLNPTFTANVGLRWEYESPFTERLGRLVNLDLAPGFAAARPVAGNGLLRPDVRGFQPRIGIAWRPVAGIVAGRARWLWHLSELVGLSGVDAVARAATAAVDDGQRREQRGASAHARQWIRRLDDRHAEHLRGRPELPCRLRAQLATARATRSSGVVDDHRDLSRHEEQPSHAGAPAEHVSNRRRNPCQACPSGFVYLTSNGSSTRHAGQLLLRRRLRNGITASAQYTLAKATDDAAAAFQRRDAQRYGHRAGLARPGRRARRIQLRSAPSTDRAGAVHFRRRRRRRRADHRHARLAAQGMDGHEPVDRRQRPAADARGADRRFREPASSGRCAQIMCLRSTPCCPARTPIPPRTWRRPPAAGALPGATRFAARRSSR